MHASKSNRWLGVPESLLLEMDNLRSEVQVLRRTVDSKAAAVVILRKQLTATQYLDQPAASSVCQATQTEAADQQSISSPDRVTSSSSVLVELLSASKRENKALKQDLMDLRCKLHDAQADLKVVRSEVPRAVATGTGPLQQQWLRQERLHLIHQMETLTQKVERLEGDVRCLTEEREELLKERQHSSTSMAVLTAQLRQAQAPKAGRASSPANVAATQTLPDLVETNGRAGNRNRKHVHSQTAVKQRGKTARESDLRLSRNCAASETSDSSDDGSVRCDGVQETSAAVARLKQERAAQAQAGGPVDSVLLQENKSLSAALVETQRELARLRAVVADYELLSSLQRAAAQHSDAEQPVAPHLPPSAGGDSTAAAPSVREENSAGAGQEVPVATAPAGGSPADDSVTVAASGPAESRSLYYEDSADESTTARRVTQGGAAALRSHASSPSKQRKQPSPPASSQNSLSSATIAETQTGCDLSVKSIDDVTTTTTRLRNLETGEADGMLSCDRFESSPVSLQSLGSQGPMCAVATASPAWLPSLDHLQNYQTISDCIEEIVPIDQIDSYVEQLKMSQWQRTSGISEDQTDSGQHGAECEAAHEDEEEGACATRKAVQQQGEEPRVSPSVAAAAGSVTAAAAGSGTATAGSVTAAAGSNTAAAGSVTAGSVTAAAGSVTAAAGSGTAAAGSVTAAAGSVTSAAGSVTTAAGSVTAAAGSVTSVAGSVTAATGSVTAAAGSVTAAAAGCASLTADVFSDYDSDDDNFEAELQQWQKSTVDLLHQTQKK